MSGRWPGPADGSGGWSHDLLVSAASALMNPGGAGSGWSGAGGEAGRPGSRSAADGVQGADCSLKECRVGSCSGAGPSESLRCREYPVGCPRGWSTRKELSRCVTTRVNRVECEVPGTPGAVRSLSPLSPWRSPEPPGFGLRLFQGLRGRRRPPCSPLHPPQPQRSRRVLVRGPRLQSHRRR